MVRFGMKTLAPSAFSSSTKRMVIARTMPVWPEISTRSPTSTRSEKMNVRPVTTSCTMPWEPNPTARPTTEALAR